MSKSKNELWTLLESGISREDLDLYVIGALEPEQMARIDEMAQASSLLRSVIDDARNELEAIKAPAGPDEAWLQRTFSNFEPAEVEARLIPTVLSVDLLKQAVQQAEALDFPPDVLGRIRRKLQKRAFQELIEGARSTLSERLQAVQAQLEGIVSPVRYSGPIFSSGTASTDKQLVALGPDAAESANQFELFADPEIQELGFANAGNGTIRVNVFVEPAETDRALHVLIPGATSGEVVVPVAPRKDAVYANMQWPRTAEEELQVFIWLTDTPDPRNQA